MPPGTSVFKEAAQGAQNPVSSEFYSLPATPSWPLSELEIIGPKVELGRSAPCTLLRAPVANGIALAQPSNWSTVTSAWAGSMDGSAGPVVIWMVSGSIPPLPVSQGGFEGTSNWNLSEADVFHVADVDGDGLDEVVVFNGTDRWIGVLRWSGTALNVWWAASGALEDQTGNGSGSWTPDAGDAYLPLRLGLGANGAVSLLVTNIDAGPRLGILGWNGSELVTLYVQQSVAVSGPGGSWTIQDSDEWWTMDLTGAGCDSLVLYNSAYFMGIVQWDAGSGAPSLAWSAYYNLPGTYTWPMNPDDQLVVASLDGKTQSLVLFNPTIPTIAVARWDAGSSTFGTV